MMTTQFVLMLAIFQFSFWDCYAVNGVIWHKQQQKFVHLFSIPQFAAAREENLAKSGAVEMDMKGEIVKAVYHEEKSMIMFHDNDTKIDGVFGDIWYLLEDYLNFTLIPIKTELRNFYNKQNDSQIGLLGILERNEAQVIPKSAFYVERMGIIDYTTPLWKSPYHIYIKSEWMFDDTWIFTLFSWQTWSLIVFLFTILSCVGYFLQKVPTEKPKHKKGVPVDFNLGDHFFYSFAIMSARGYIPDAFYNKFKILSLSKSIFAWLILLAFSSHLIYRMTTKEQKLPFQDLESLIFNTKYVLLVYRDKFHYESFNQRYGSILGKSLFAHVRSAEYMEDVYSEICNSEIKYALFEHEDRFMTLNKNYCPLQAIGNYNETWTTFAFQKNYRYKRNFDYALIKFREVGLIDVLRDRWLNIRMENIDQATFDMIDLDQVYLIFIILCYGALISFAILVLENITYYYKMKKARRYKRTFPKYLKRKL